MRKKLSGYELIYQLRNQWKLKRIKMEYLYVWVRVINQWCRN